jgi:hypothetical protein
VLGDLVTLATRHFKRGDKIRLTGPRHPPSAEAGGLDGAEPRSRRGHQDQSQQEDRIPTDEGTEGGPEA